MHTKPSSEPSPGEDRVANPSHHAPANPTGGYLAALSLAALGVVYGDIGTSPLYAIRDAFQDEHGLYPTVGNILGILSLVFWALILIISVKYLVFILRADNRGEGGILALTSLVTPVGATKKGGRGILILLGLFGTALLYGDGMLTPAVTVLSAVEGLEVATPFFQPYIVLITVVIIVATFAVQSRGTATVGKIFGPVTLLWFVTIAVLGFPWIIREPGVLWAINPLYGVRFFLENGWNGFLALGAVFLVVTGGEALYADMGHFGRKPIRLAWFALVLPALLINYFGQGAMLMRRPEAVHNPFYAMAPGWALYPIVLIATMAAVIASQALISGAFSLTMQAVQLGYAPRMRIEHTSEREAGQIYMPAINWALMLSCIALVIGFQSSSRLTAAYGVAVTTTMVITTLLFYVVERELWKWSMPVAFAVAGFFLVIDLGFWGANIIKIPHGGWLPLVVGAVVFTLLTTWKKGRRILSDRLRAQTLPRELFLKEVETAPPVRVPGTAVFMYSDPDGTPPALLHSMKHYKVLHEQLVFLSVQTAEVPYVDKNDRVQVARLGSGIYQVVLSYGFMEDVDIPAALSKVSADGLRFPPMDTSYFLGRETLIATNNPGMAIWREKLFAVMAQNAGNAGSYFRLPPNRVVELGAQIEL